MKKSMSETLTPALEIALKAALSQYRKKMGKEFPYLPSLDIYNDAVFWALAELQGEHLSIRVGGGVVPILKNLWEDVFTNADLIFGDEIPFLSDKVSALDMSLMWLIFHEMHHAALGHFELIHGTPFHLVSRVNRETAQLEDIPIEMHCKIAPCLELQADHDALEMMLDGYSSGKWDRIRTQVVSIVAVMILIEQADERDGDSSSTHPQAATRIFQLLGHVVEMWSIPAHAQANARGKDRIRETELPSEEEKQAFSKEVILPAFWGAVALAEVAGAKSIVADLGSPEVFFEDIGRAKLGQWDELVTVGAKEWAELKELNVSVLEHLGHSST